MPCGLIVNELVSNALKHAFLGNNARSRIEAAEHQPEVRIGLGLEGSNVVLKVADNGIGLPAGLQVATTRTLGLQLVNTLVNQIDGTVHVTIEHGTEFKVVFPVKGA